MRTFRADVCSLYRRSLRMAALSVPEHRAWMLRYVRDRFRDVPAGADFARRVREGEEELERHILTLRRAGRLPVDGCHAAVAAPPSLGPPAAAPSVDAATTSTSNSARARSSSVPAASTRVAPHASSSRCARRARAGRRHRHRADLARVRPAGCRRRSRPPPARGSRAASRTRS